VADDERFPSDWDVDDDELDEWVEEWKEVDRAAAEFVRNHLSQAPPVAAPGPAVDRAVERFTAGIAEARWPYDYFVNALGSWHPAPGQEATAWLTAAASTINPPEDPGTDIEGQAAVMALAHADWLGLVLGLVGRGVGAELTAEAAQQDIVSLEDVDGEIEDLDGHLSALEMALVTIAPLWQAIGALDEDDRLTEVGRRGLPHALVTAWSAPRT
jgi:hypothetical protein